MKCSEASSEQRISSEPETGPISIGDSPSCLQPAKGGHGSRGDKTPRHHSKSIQIHSEANPNPSRITLSSVPCSSGLKHHADSVFLNIMYKYIANLHGGFSCIVGVSYSGTCLGRTTNRSSLAMLDCAAAIFACCVLAC